jgi:hypothetical protein
MVIEKVRREKALDFFRSTAAPTALGDQRAKRGIAFTTINGCIPRLLR